MPTVCIADDDRDIRKILAEAFRKKGFTVKTAENGEEAVCMIREESIDIAVLDIVMPEKGGMETLLDVRKNHPDLKIILITGKVPTDNVPFQNLKEHFNVQAVYTKPFEIKELVNKVSELTGL